MFNAIRTLMNLYELARLSRRKSSHRLCIKRSLIGWAPWSINRQQPRASSRSRHDAFFEKEVRELTKNNKKCGDDQDVFLLEICDCSSAAQFGTTPSRQDFNTASPTTMLPVKLESRPPPRYPASRTLSATTFLGFCPQEVRR